MGVSLVTGTLLYAQKDELKAAEKALKNGDLPAAKAALGNAEPSIAGAEEKYQTQFYYLTGKLYADMVKKGMQSFESADAASVAFSKLAEIEKKSGKEHYGNEVKQIQNQIVEVLLKNAQESYKAKDYKTSGKGFEKVYRLSPRDTLFLYNAALMATIDKEYPVALKYYEELKTLKYTGIEIEYTAINKETNAEEKMNSKQERDLYVKAGTHIKPSEKKTESKRAEIVKNIALIYLELGKNDEALKAFADARAESPNDVNLILNQANIYIQLNEKEGITEEQKAANRDKFKALMAEAAAKDPNNPDLHYNIGVINMEQKNYESAREAYKKALSIKPNYINASLNLSTTYINEGNALIEEMNKLGNSKADIKKYDDLKAKKDDLFKKGALILEDSLKNNPGDKMLLEQLKNIYGALGDNENYSRIKKQLGN